MSVPLFRPYIHETEKRYLRLRLLLKSEASRRLARDLVPHETPRKHTSRRFK